LLDRRGVEPLKRGKSGLQDLGGSQNIAAGAELYLPRDYRQKPPDRILEPDIRGIRGVVMEPGEDEEWEDLDEAAADDSNDEKPVENASGLARDGKRGTDPAQLARRPVPELEAIARPTLAEQPLAQPRAHPLIERWAEEDLLAEADRPAYLWEEPIQYLVEADADYGAIVPFEVKKAPPKPKPKSILMHEWAMENGLYGEEERMHLGNDLYYKMSPPKFDDARFSGKARWFRMQRALRRRKQLALRKEKAAILEKQGDSRAKYYKHR
jgi:hypothetical protein